MKVVLAKMQMDLDGYACAYAYSEFLNKSGIETKTLCTGSIPMEIKYLLNRFQMRPMTCDIKLINQADGLILVDASDVRGLPELDPDRVVEVIDHRPVHRAEKLFVNAKLQIEMVGAAATLIVERFIKNQVKISHESAILLYCAIVIHSINLQGNTVVNRDRRAVKWLKKQAVMPVNLIHDILVNKSDWRKVNLGQEILRERKQINFGQTMISIGQLEVINLAGLIEENREILFGLVEEMKKIDGTNLGFINNIDIEKAYSILITKDTKVQEVLIRVLGVNFKDGMAKSEIPYLRKELIHMLTPSCYPISSVK